MKLIKVTMNGFRGLPYGLNESVNLEGVDVIVGPNGTGKTRILQAVQLALSGKVPDPLAGKNVEALEMTTGGALGSGFQVAVDIENGPLSGIVRTFDVEEKADGSPTVKKSIVLEPMLAEGHDRSDEKIKEICAASPYALDASQFQKMTSSERQTLVFNLCKIDDGKWTPEKVIEQITAVIPSDPAFGDEHAVVEQRLIKDVAIQLGRNIRQGLPVLSRWLKDRLAKAQKQVKEFNAAALGGTKMRGKSVDPTKTLRPMPDIMDEVKKAEEDYGKLERQTGTAKATALRVRDKQREIAALEEKIGGILVDRKDIVDTLEVEVANLAAASTAQVPEGLTSLLAMSMVRKADMSACMVDHEQAIAVLRSQASDLKGRHEKLIADHKCPFCGGPSSEEVVSPMEKEIERLNAEIARTMTMISSDMDAIRAADLEIESFKKETKDHAMKVAEARAKHMSKKEQLDLSKAKIARVVDLNEQLKAVRNRRIEGGTESIDVVQAESMLTGFKTRLEALRNEMLDRQKYDAELEASKRAAIEAKQAEFEVDVLKAWIGVVSDVRWGIIREALEPVEIEVRDLFTLGKPDRAGEYDLVFRTADLRGNDDFDVCWHRLPSNGTAEKWIGFDTLSTGEKLITMIAILAPLIHRAAKGTGLRIMLLDNAEVIDDQSRDRVLQMIYSAKSIFLDNVIMTSSSPAWSSRNEAVKIHVLGAPVNVEA